MVDLNLYVSSLINIGSIVEQEIRGRHSKTRKRLVQDQYDLDLTFIHSILGRFIKGLGANRKAKKITRWNCPFWVQLGSDVYIHM